MDDGGDSSKRRLSPKSIGSAAGEKILSAVDEGVRVRWPRAIIRANAVQAPTIDKRVDLISRPFRKELSIAGGLVGGSAAIPGVGTATSAASFAAELSWSTIRLADLILTIAAAHGHAEASVEERRLWVLSVLAYGDAASSVVTRLAGEMGKGLGARATRRIPMETLRALNGAIGRTIVTKYGTKRGVLALGRAIPFGVGAGVGYGLNNYIVRQTTRSTHRFFSDIPRELAAD